METSALDALQYLVAELRKKNAEVVPKGWVTVEQWAVRAGVSVSHAGNVLRRARRAGVIEAKQYRIDTGEKVAPVWHYRAPGKTR